MTLNKPMKILVGIATIWYALYLFLMIVGMFLLIGYVFVPPLHGPLAAFTLLLAFTLVMIQRPRFHLHPLHLCFPPVSSVSSIERTIRLPVR